MDHQPTYEELKQQVNQLQTKILRLRESEKWYREIFNATNDAIFIHDTASGAILDVNRTMLDMFEYSREEVLQLTISDLSPSTRPFSENEAVELIQKAASEGPQVFQWLAKKKSGEHFVVEVALRSFDIEGEKRVLAVVRDITDRERAKEALQESEEKYRSIVENALVGIFTVDEAYRFIYVNDELCRVLGHSRQALIGMDFRQVLTDNSREFVADRYRRRQRGEPVPDRYELELIHKNGEVRYAEMTVALVRDTKDRPRSVGQLVDITERKRTEASLRQSEARYRIITELMLDYAYAYRVEPDGSFIHEWSTDEPAIRLTGYRPQEVGSSLILYHPDDQERVRRDVQQTIAGKPTSADYRIITKAGELRWVHIDRRPVWDTEQRRVARFYGVAQDVTERKVMEEALRVKEYAIESSINAIAIADLSGNLTYVNPSFLKLWGYDSEAEVLGRPAVSFWFEPVRAQEIVGALADHHSWQGEMVAKRKDGCLFAAQLSASLVVDAAGQPVNMMASFVDITDQKQAEAEREALIAELEAKNAELERFTYTVSHDLKSPLVTIKGFLGLLEKDVAKQDTPRIQGDIQRIREAADRMQLLLDDLLELSRIGRLVNPPEEVKLTELVREATELVAGQIAERGVQVDIDPDLPAVCADRPRLLEVFQNLIQNGVKFMGDHTEPRIEVGFQQADEEETIFYVRDNGVGIEPQYYEKVFGLFERLDSNVEGTGIGLALVKRIIEVHGGRIWVESAGAGQGSTFLFTLPLAPDKARP